jgi:quinol monooxygenase YgiN
LTLHEPTANIERMSSKVATIVTVKARPGKRDEVLALFKQHLAPRATANASQEVVAWVADAADPDAFHLFEIYSDRAAMEKNAQADWFGAYMAQAGPLLAGMPEMKTGEPRWVKA